MKIELYNVGYVKKAILETNNLTIICGENNTGKTYITYVFYALLQKLHDFRTHMHFYSLSGVKKQENGFLVIDDIERKLKDFNEYLKLEIKSDLPRILAADLDKFKNSIINFYIDKDILNYILKNNSEQSYIKNGSLYIKNSIFEDKIEFLQDFENDGFVAVCGYLRDILRELYPSEFIMSIERTGVSVFKNELAYNQRKHMYNFMRIGLSERKKRPDLFDFERSEFISYSLPLEDNISTFLLLDDIERKKSFLLKNENNALGKEIIDLFNQIANGDYIIKNNNVYFKPKDSEDEYQILSCSSSVRSLVMLRIYLYNIVQKNSVLIIDEPELNLHPKNQVLLGRLFALLVKAKVKLFITTHSDYIVRELSNCIMLNNLDDETILKIKHDVFGNNYSVNMKLASEELAVYMSKEANGSNLHNVRVNNKTGIALKTFNNIIMAQNNNQSELYSLIDYI